MTRITLQSDANFQRRLRSFKIYTTVSGEERPVRAFVADSSVQIEPYVGFYAGGVLCTMGAFSYARSGSISE